MSERESGLPPFAYSTLIGPRDLPPDGDEAFARFKGGQTVLMIKADPAHLPLLAVDDWLRVRVVGPDWFALSAT